MVDPFTKPVQMYTWTPIWNLMSLIFDDHNHWISNQYFCGIETLLIVRTDLKVLSIEASSFNFVHTYTLPPKVMMVNLLLAWAFVHQVISPYWKKRYFIQTSTSKRGTDMLPLYYWGILYLTKWLKDPMLRKLLMLIACKWWINISVPFDLSKIKFFFYFFFFFQEYLHSEDRQSFPYLKCGILVQSLKG